MFFSLMGQNVFAQNNDTVRVFVKDTVFDSVLYYDTIVKIDTIWIDPAFKGIQASVGVSSFMCTWRKYNDEILRLLNQRNYSAGVGVDFLFSNWRLGTGIFFTSFSESRQFGFSMTDIDSIIHMQLIPNSYQIIDTTSVSWEYFTHDTTYFDPDLNDSVTITTTDSIPTYQTDTTTINYNDTTYNTTYDTIRSDTVVAKSFKYSYLEVPLIVRLNLYKYRSFSFDAGIGIIAGLLIKSESYFFDVGTNSVRAYSKDDTYKFLPSLWLSLGINYAYKERFIISLEPFYNPGLRSVYIKELPVIKIPDRYGIRFGVSYRF
jgi:hypothetical protein